MKHSKTLTVLAFLALSFGSAGWAAEEGGHVEQAGSNPRDIAAVQRGARLFVNYCFSCHSAKYMRYNRLAEDLNLTEDMVMENFVFSDAKIGDTMDIAMRPKDAQSWLNKPPPDLSLIARSRGPDWLFGYLKSFYKDERGGWNNLSLPNAAMPNVLWELQGIQELEHGAEGQAGHLVLTTPGLQSREEFEESVRDIVTFLDYLSEPAKLHRERIGIWVLLFLTLFAGCAYALKSEYWRDIH